MNLITLFKKDFSLSALIAGIIAIIVGYAGPTILVFQVAINSNLTDSQITSWLWAYSISSGIVTIFASILTKQPMIMAWSTPGIAFLVFSLKDTPFDVAVGAFVLSNILILIIGLTGVFKRLMDKIPMNIAGALNAGILLPFALEIVGVTKSAPEITLPMVIAYFIIKKFSQRWVVAIVFFIGILMSFLFYDINLNLLKFEFVQPVFVMPTFELSAFINLAIPLTVLALTGQYLPGITVLKSFGYVADSNFIVKICSFASILVAPFGCHNINPSSMIASIVAGPDAHADKNKRYWAAIVAGFTYIVFGTFAGTFVYLFHTFPSAMITSLAGLSLLSAIIGSLNIALNDKNADSTIPIVVFCVALSGIEFFSIGSSFWAIVTGMVLLIVDFIKNKNYNRS